MTSIRLLGMGIYRDFIRIMAKENTENSRVPSVFSPSALVRPGSKRVSYRGRIAPRKSQFHLSKGVHKPSTRNPEVCYTDKNLKICTLCGYI